MTEPSERVAPIIANLILKIEKCNKAEDYETARLLSIKLVNWYQFLIDTDEN